ncbi:MAG: NAD-dependent epimerase/dehydratase family protein [Planctomycetes bacterium]|nr:NAD-dependent epimerase/dehydratase family protein [Planctomycetota bacterium]
MAYVTGATGFVGSHVADLLDAQGVPMRLLVRSRARLDSQYHKNTEITEGSLDQPPEKLAQGLKNATHIFHIAGLIGAIRQEEFDHVNIEGTRNLIEAVRMSGTMPQRFVLVSSLAAHGPSSSHKEPRLEHHESAPRTMYGRSKLAGEKLAVELCARYGIPLTVIRPTGVYGPRDRATFELFKFMARGIELGVGGGPRHFDLIHGRDLARGIVMAAHSERAINQAYYLTDEGRHELGTVLGILRDVMAPKLNIRLNIPVFMAASLARINDALQSMTGTLRLPNSDKLEELLAPSWCCSGEKARRDFGFACEVPLRDGLAETAKWYKDAGWLR